MKKNNLFLVFVLTSSMFFMNDYQVYAQFAPGKRTMWRPVESSLTDLLNSGWKLVSFSSDRAATATGGGIGAIDEQTFSYILYKDGKYITCFITNPH